MGIVKRKIPGRYKSGLEVAHTRLNLFRVVTKQKVELPEELLYPHTVWYLHAGKLLEGQTLAQSVRRAAWAYYFRNGRTMACALMEIAPGRRETIWFSHGSFVAQIVRLIERTQRDPRLKGKKVELRVLLAPALHYASLWLRGGRGAEYFVGASKSRDLLKFGRWLSRKELEGALRDAAERARAAQSRMRELLARKRAKDS